FFEGPEDLGVAVVSVLKVVDNGDWLGPCSDEVGESLAENSNRSPVWARYACLLLPSVVIASVRLLGSLRMALSACPGLMIVRSPTSKSYWRYIHARLQMFGLPRSANRVALRSSGI